MADKKYLLLSLILLTAFFIYSPSLKNDFIWDDYHLVVDSVNIKSFRNLPAVFTGHLFETTGGSNFYRPLAALSFMCDFFLWKLNPFGYHLTNLILHLLTVLLVYLFVSRVFRNPDMGLLACLIFAVHPVNTETVTYIAGRADPLSSIFFLSALLFYMRFKEAGRRLSFFLSILFFIFALLTKEATLVFPLVLIIYDVFILKENSVNKKTLGLYAPYFLAVIIYISFRLFVLGMPLGFMRHMPYGLYLFTIPKIIILYLGLLFFPVILHMERIEPAVNSVFNPQAAVFFTTIIFIIWFLALLYRRNKKLFFFAIFFIITLMPMLNILVINALMAEHWLYLPSIGIYSIVSFGLLRGQGALRKPAVVILVGYLSFFMARTVIRNIEWGNPGDFYRNLLEYSPSSVRGHQNMASIYLADQNFKLARQEFEISARYNPANPFSYQGLAALDYEEGKIKEAMQSWKKALDLAPFYRPSHIAMSRALYKENRKFRMLLKAVAAKPDDIMANYKLAGVYLKNGLYMEGLERLERILEIEPNNSNALFNSSWVYLKLGIYTKAIEGYKKVMALTPDDPDVYKHLSYCYACLNKHKKSEEMFKKYENLKR